MARTELVDMAKGHIARAPRFALSFPLRYRPIGSTAWREASVENISGTGVLFRADDSLESGLRIEMTFTLRSMTGGLPGGNVSCAGRIIRTAPPREADGQPAFAAAITNFRLLRDDGPDAQPRVEN